MSELTKEFFEQKLEAQTKELRAFTEDKATEIDESAETSGTPGHRPFAATDTYGPINELWGS